MQAIIAVSLGNTSVRWGLWADGDFSLRGGVRTLELGERPLLAPGAAGSAPDAPAVAAVASVVPAAEPKLAELLRREANLAPVWLGRDLAVPLELDVDEPAAVGADRLAAALAAHRRFGAAVVVDFGTAVTVNAVSAGGVFLGGAILPGPALCLEALASGTGRVRVPGPPEPVAPPGRSTREAVHAALTHGLAGAVDRLVELCLTRLGGTAALAATGGGAGLLAPLCRTRFAVLPDLVLEGLVVAVEEAG